MSRARYPQPATGSRLNMSPSAATPDAPPAVPGGRVLYLDFDGVLHPEDVWRPPGRAPRVEDWPSWWRGRLVRTDPVLGISAPEVLEELQEKLAREMRDGSAADKA